MNDQTRDHQNDIAQNNIAGLSANGHRGVSDPTGLPLFATADITDEPRTDELRPDEHRTDELRTAEPGRRPGRVRGTFLMRPATPAADSASTAASTPGGLPLRPPLKLRALDTGAPPPAGAAATSAASVPSLASRVSPRQDGGGIARQLDWALVAAFRAQASDRLTAALGSDRGRMSRAEQEQLGRAIIVDLLEAAAAESVNEGTRTWSLGEQDALAEAVFNALFKLGRLQPLVDDDRVENIIISGHDRVVLELVDGTLMPGPAVADSDQELIDFLVFLASRSEVNARPFSEAQPRLHLRLDGGARLAAAAWVTPRPSVVIRRHRLMRVTLADLVDRDTLTPVAASFLRAAVRARKSIVVAGPQGSGKTTMVRALCAEIGTWEAIGTFETEYELHLHELTEQHPIVHAWESRPRSGEHGPDGKQAGEFTLDEALYDSFRFNLSRQIVGEVRGKEIWAMIKAMESGAGSISTTHAADAEAAIRKLVTCAMEAGSHVTQGLATSKLAETIDIIVQLHLETTPNADGTARRDRWVSEIIAIAPGEKEKGYATTHVFRPAPGRSAGRSPGRSAIPGVLPDEYRALEQYGFQLRDYLTEGQAAELGAGMGGYGGAAVS
jgi:pilus assembly protein CpaF